MDFREWTSETGTYATSTTVSSPGTHTVQGLDGGVIWLQVDEFSTGNSAGQSQTALYTTRTARKSILFNPLFPVDSRKVANIILFN